MHIKKRLVALLMASVMMFTMIGCSDPNNADETEETSVDIEQVVVGTWICEWVVSASEDNGFMVQGDEMTLTIELYRGGTGSIDWYNSRRHEHSEYSLSWEAADDDLINIDISTYSNTSRRGLEYDADEDTLSYVDGSHTLTRES